MQGSDGVLAICSRLCVVLGFERATSRFAHLEKLSLNFSSSSSVIRVNLSHP